MVYVKSNTWHNHINACDNEWSSQYGIDLELRRLSCVYFARDVVHASKQYALKHIICSDEESMGEGSQKQSITEVLATYSMMAHRSSPSQKQHLVSSIGKDLDSSLATSLKSDQKKGVIPLAIQLDTKVKVKIGGLKTSRFMIRVKCDGLKSNVPKGKTLATLSSSSDTSCDVKLRIKIWKWTF
ncbi:hypothetical protein NE237_025324 [Protea cynaroides]|uniref:Uncharacterized protein n=1 Tax=Protea cynaroides TaxID=273540 RepID=A0A9Q0H254_9MAGN|nr:hypothetical protein NE237_025324 [Protea cynaroides]